MQNERQKIKVTIQSKDNTMEKEVCGIAFVTCEDRDGKQGNSIGLVGKLSLVDLLGMHKAIREELLKAVEESYMEHAEKHSLGDLVALAKAVAGVE